MDKALVDKALFVEEWRRLSNSERIALCHRMAAEADIAAASAAPQLQEPLKHIAARWLELAAGLEAAR